MIPPINWSDIPPDRVGGLKIYHAPTNGILEMRILSNMEFGVFGHWDDRSRRNRPCIDPHGCICQERSVSMWWKCYLGIQLIHGHKVGLAEVTSDAWRGCAGTRLREARGDLRGLKLVLSREPHTPQGRVVCQLYEPSVDLRDGLPPSPDVKEELQRIWFARL